MLRRYQRDRFVRPGGTPWRAARRAEDVLLGCLPPRAEVVPLAPLVPLGTHSALATVSQHKVVTAIRACEVAADPTNALALEAAVRRAGAAGGGRAARRRPAGRPRAAVPGWLGRALRPVRDGHRGPRPGQPPLRGEASAEQLRFAVTALRAAGVARVQVALTPLSDAGERIAAATSRGPGGAAPRPRSSPTRTAPAGAATTATSASR